MKNFAGKIALITGGASGAGLGQAKVFSKAGMRVAVADMRQDALDSAISEIAAYSGAKKDSLLALKTDLTNREEYAAAADKLETVFGGPPHLLIQTAGVNSFGPAEASTFDDYDWVMGVCLNAVVNGLVIFVPRIIKAYAGKTECHIAVTSSVGGLGGCATTAPYSAAKAAVNNLMESYYLSLKPYGIGVSTLCPMNINSTIWETERRRPEQYRNSGYNTTDDVIDLLKEHVSTGIDPLELAERFKKGIEAEQVYIIPYPNSYEIISREHERIRNYTSPDGMVKERAKENYMAEMAEKGGPPPGDIAVLYSKGPKVGFGKARADFDWIDQSHKFAGAAGDSTPN